MLYGFSSIAPAVVVSGGAYTSASIRDPYMIDYHRLYISLRWVGEYLNRYSRSFSNTDSVIKFAPSFPEIDLLTPMKLAENIIIPENGIKYGRFSKAAESTYKYYEACIEAYGVSSYTKMAASRVNVTLDKEMSVSIDEAYIE
jgi:hypothetical protein